jgi:hypothetical protein
MTQTLRSNRGIALPLALFAIVIMGALITALFTVTRLEQRQGDNSVASLQAFEAAEAGLATLLNNWTAGNYNALALNTSATGSPVTLGGGAQYQTTIRRTSPTTFLVTSEGRVVTANGVIRNRRQVAQMVRMITPALGMQAAVTTLHGLDVSGSAEVSGADSIPGGWGAVCPPAGAGVAGIRDSAGNIHLSNGCITHNCVTGSPATMADPTITSGSFNNFGDFTFSDLAAMATKTLNGGTWNGIQPAVTSGTPQACNYGVLTNWGAPRSASTHPCFNYFPIIYASSSIRLTGGTGQGILLVNGDLDISGGFEFFGPVIVRGEIRSTGTGGHIYGGVMSQDANFDVSLISGNSVVNYSACAVNRALQGSALGRPVGNRSWVAVF